MNILETVQAEMEIELDNPSEARILEKILKLEAEDSPSSRSRIFLHSQGKTLKIDIRADDSTSFRAVLNSYIRWLKLADEILKLKDSR